MGSVGDAYDNAMAESFFATLEWERVLDRVEDRGTATLECTVPGNRLGYLPGFAAFPTVASGRNSVRGWLTSRRSP